MFGFCFIPCSLSLPFPPPPPLDLTPPCADSARLAFKTPPCVPSTRSHVEHVWACCRHTQRRFECTHGGVVSLHTVGFSACQTTVHNTTTPHNSKAAQTHTHHAHTQTLTAHRDKQTHPLYTTHNTHKTRTQHTTHAHQPFKPHTTPTHRASYTTHHDTTHTPHTQALNCLNNCPPVGN